MRLFTVRVGRTTRSGNFQEYTSRAVSVSDDKIDTKLVRYYFQVQYVGFEIELIEAKEITDITNALPELPNATKEAGTIADFYIEHTKDEKKLFEEIRQLFEQINDKKQELHRSIASRYDKLSYVRQGYSIGLSTDHSGTLCTKLRVKSNDFFKVVRQGTEGGDASEELIIGTAK